MFTPKNTFVRNKFIDLDLEDCVLPHYLTKRLTAVLENQTLPHMCFIGSLWDPKAIVANAIAKKLNAELIALEFNQEPRVKAMKKGERTLTILKYLLKTHRLLDERKIFIIEDLRLFPKSKLNELFEIIQVEPFHRFIFFNSDQSLTPQHLPSLPHISFDFKIDHSPQEADAYWQQCAKLAAKYNKKLSVDELKHMIKNTYFFWLLLFGRDTLQSLRKELKFIQLNPMRINA